MKTTISGRHPHDRFTPVQIPVKILEDGTTTESATNFAGPYDLKDSRECQMAINAMADLALGERTFFVVDGNSDDHVNTIREASKKMELPVCLWTERLEIERDMSDHVTESHLKLFR